MSYKTLVIYQNKILFNILNEISENISFNIEYVEKAESDFNQFENYLILTQKKILEINNQLIIDFFPIKIDKLIEIINVNFLKKDYSSQSKINIGKYELDMNSRVLNFKDISLDLTEMEANIILFLKKSKDPINVKMLQKEVWGHVPDLETHTVETHIYRLRKKIKDKFQDDNFIKSLKNGYQIS